MTIDRESAAAFVDWDVSNTGEPYIEAKLTVTEGTWMSLDISPDGKTLTFDMLGDIYSIPVTGGDATLIHGGPAMEIRPRFSPDGSKILYISDRDGSYNLWVSKVDGSEARQISHETVNVLSAPAWLADGNCVAATKFFPKLPKLLASEIWFYHIDGGQGRLLVETPENGKAVNEPEFSHDGRYLYYTENLTPPAFLFVNALQPSYAIKRRTLSDGTVEEVVCGFGSATTARVSPDDKQIAFIRRVKDKTVLFVYDTETGKQRPVYDGLERDLHAHWNPRMGGYYTQYAWFPDGRHIAIWAKGKFYKINAETRAKEEIPFRVTAKHRMTIPPRFESQLAPKSFSVRAIQQIAVAPNGQNIAFNALGHLWHKSLPDGKPERLTKSSDFEFDPNYSNDGSSLAYVSWDDERGSALEIMTVKNRHITTLLRGVGVIRQPAFSPDCKHLVYRVEHGQRKTGGYRAKPGLYWIAIADGKPHYLGPEGKNPQFSPNGERIYYTAKGVGFFGIGTGNSLESVNLDGFDKRLHVTSDETEELRISPDLQWLAYKKDLQYYVIPYRETGAPFRLTKSGKEMPAVKLTECGGYGIAWSADSSQANWVLGQSFFTALVKCPTPVNATLAAETTINLEVPADKPEGIIAFTNGRIITMQGEQVIERGSLVVKDNLIVAVGPVDQIDIPKAATVIDVTDKTLMPGLVDMHGHLEFREGDLLMPQKHPSHYAALAFGVTTNFDPAASDLPGFAHGEMKIAGVTVGPRFITTGEIIYGMDALGLFNPISKLDDAREIVARKKALGAIIIKNYMQPMRSQRQQLIKAAREARLMVTPEGEGHFYNNLSMILDGHVSVEHNFPLANFYDDVIQLMTQGGTSVTPTLLMIYGEMFGENYFYQITRPWDDPKIRMYVQKTFSEYSPLGSASEAPPYVRGMIGIHQAEELWDIGFRSVARSIKKLDDAGVVVNTGGHGQIQGLNMHWEMWAMSEGGMSNHRILRAATLNGAKTIGLEKQIGTLEVGKLADLIVLDENPLENIRNTNSVRYAMVNGRLYDALTLNEIGNYDRVRSKFYWELEDYDGIDWNEAWGGSGSHSETGGLVCCLPINKA